MTQYRVKLKDLNERYLSELRERHANGDVEVTIYVNDEQDSSISNEALENLFWQVIDRLDWEAKEDAAIVAPAVDYLSQQATDGIIGFADILSEKLYLLDQRRMAEQSIDDEEEFSTDLFLYARCAVVANGKTAYETVLADPTAFPKDTFFSALLNLPDLAWKHSTGETFDYLPQYIYETGFNPQGWPDDVITL
jgi:hypothetical protein